MYGILIHDDKISRISKIFSNKLEAMEYLEILVEDFLTIKNGEERGKSQLINEPSSYKSIRWGILPFGYFKTRNTSESLYKITVWRKDAVAGLIFNSYNIEKVFSVDLCLLPDWENQSIRNLGINFPDEDLLLVHKREMQVILNAINTVGSLNDGDNSSEELSED